MSLRSRLARVAVLTLAASAITAGGASAAQVVDLGSFLPDAVNSSDLVIGSDGASGVWHEGAVTHVQAPGTGGPGAVYDINNSGRIVGDAYPKGPDQYTVEAATWDWPALGTPRLLGYLDPVGGPCHCGYSDAYGVNANGEVAGGSRTGSTGGNNRATIWRADGTGPIQVGAADAPSGGGYSYAQGLSDAGQILGGWYSSSSTSFRNILWPNETQAGTSLNLVYNTSQGGSHLIAGDGTIVGRAGITAYERAPDGTQTPMGNFLPAAVNQSHDVVGNDFTQPDSEVPVEWSKGTLIHLSSLLPAGSGWKLTYVRDIADNGDIVGQGTLNGVAHGFLILRSLTKVSGTIYGTKCGRTSCSRAGLPKITILVTGKASDGQAVTRTATSGDDGAWSVTVPPGSYRAGPTRDRATIDGTGFDPTEAKVPVASQPVTGIDFSTCAGAGSTSGAHAISTTARAARGPVARAAAASLPSPSECQSLYTVKLSASIPQRLIVDPSLKARYNVSGNPDRAGYNAGTGGLAGLVHSKRLRHAITLTPEFPGCLPDRVVKRYTEEDARAEWYTYIKGKAELGKVSATFLWNQSTQEARLVGGPDLASHPITRVFKYRISFGKKHHKTGTCSQTTRLVPVLSAPVGGADGTKAHLADNEFAMIATWAFPFDVPGVKIYPDTLLEQLVARGAPLVKRLYELADIPYKHFEKLPKPVRFGIEFAVTYGLGSGAVKALEHGPKAIALFLKGAEYAADNKHKLEALGAIAEYLHHAHTYKELREFPEAYFSEPDLPALRGGYPIMAAIVRGTFETRYLPVLDAGQKIPSKTSLGLSVKSSRFPNIALSVTRKAKPTSPDPTKVFNGVLPWTTPTSQSEPVGTYNPFRANPPFLIADSLRTHHDYLSGKDAVENIHKDTSETPAVASSIEETGSLEGHFDAEEAEARDPTCDRFGDATSPATICWLLSGGRP